MKGNEGICLGNDPECNENLSWAIIQLNLDDESSGDNRPHGRVQRSCNQAGRAKCVFVENFEVAFIGSLQNLPKCNSISDHFNPFWIISPFFETKSINLSCFLRFSFFRADNSRPPPSEFCRCTSASLLASMDQIQSKIIYWGLWWPFLIYYIILLQIDTFCANLILSCSQYISFVRENTTRMPCSQKTQRTRNHWNWMSWNVEDVERRSRERRITNTNRSGMMRNIFVQIFRKFYEHPSSVEKLVTKSLKSGAS